MRGDVRTRFKAGASGNPGGRPKQVMRLLKLARKHSHEALRYAVELLREAPIGDEPRDMISHRKVKLEAAKFLWSYGVGAPPKHIDAEDAAQKPSAADELTVEELRALARREMKMEREAEEAPDGAKH